MPRPPGAGSGSSCDVGKVSRYTDEQVTTLYQGCTEPNHSERQGMINMCSPLVTNGSNQIWFQNHSSEQGKGHVNVDEDGGEYSWYTAEQVVTLEYLYGLYSGCTESKHSERQRSDPQVLHACNNGFKPDSNLGSEPQGYAILPGGTCMSGQLNN